MIKRIICFHVGCINDGYHRVKSKGKVYWYCDEHVPKLTMEYDEGIFEVRGIAPP